MDPINWLKKVEPGFNQLSDEEQNAIRDFSLLWSLFEGKILNTNANAKTLIKSVNVLKDNGKLTLKPFAEAIQYFSSRYYNGVALTPEFQGLNLRQSDHISIVEKVVKGHSTDEAETLSAILIIVLRLRNNLFHGIKWSYRIRGQLENFTNASNVIMSVMTLHGQ